MVLATICLNLSGGDCVEDLQRLERGDGFNAILRAVEDDFLSRAERRSLTSHRRRARAGVAVGAVGLVGAVLPRIGQQLDVNFCAYVIRLWQAVAGDSAVRARDDANRTSDPEHPRSL